MHIGVCVQGTDGNVYVGPSVIVWAGFHYGGKCRLVMFEGTMNQQGYRRVLQQNVLCWTLITFQNKFVPIKVNALPHTPQQVGIS